MIKYVKKGCIIFIWVDEVRIGEISRVTGPVKEIPCSTCGHQRSHRVTKGYSLVLYGRYWTINGELNYSGGHAGRTYKRLYEAQAVVTELYDSIGRDAQ